MPELLSTTDYDSLLKMMAAFDTYYDMMLSNGPSEEETLNTFAIMTDGILNKVSVTELLARIKASQVGTNLGPFTSAQDALLTKNSTDVVQLYWQDLLTSSAIAQGRTPPTFPD